MSFPFNEPQRTHIHKSAPEESVPVFHLNAQVPAHHNHEEVTQQALSDGAT